jgi:hypothetical protein
MFNLEEAVKHHGTFIFGSPENSKGTDKSGDEYDYSFNTETGRVSYNKDDDGAYLVNLNNIHLDKIETRKITLEQLTKWFYELSDEYFNENIKDIPLEGKE